MQPLRSVVNWKTKTGKIFITLANFVHLPYISQKCDLSESFCRQTIFAVRLTNMLNTSQRLFNKNSLAWWYVFKTSWRCLQALFARRFENVLKLSWRRLEDVLARRLEDALKMSWKRLEDVLKTYGQDEYIGLNQDVLKTSAEDVWLIRLYSSSSRRL